MRAMTERKMRAGLSVYVLAWAFLALSRAYATDNIDPTNKHAYAENTGWVNAAPMNGGVTVHFDGTSGCLTGLAWGENVGWIKLGWGWIGPLALTMDAIAGHAAPGLGEVGDRQPPTCRGRAYA